MHMYVERYGWGALIAGSNGHNAIRFDFTNTLCGGKHSLLRNYNTRAFVPIRTLATSEAKRKRIETRQGCLMMSTSWPPMMKGCIPKGVGTAKAEQEANKN